MPRKLFNTRLPDPNIKLTDKPIPTSTSNQIIIPRQRTNSLIMKFQIVDLFLSFNVENLYTAFRGTNSYQVLVVRVVHFVVEVLRNLRRAFLVEFFESFVVVF